MPRVLRQLVVVRIAQELHRIIQHQVEQRVVTLQNTGRLSTTGEFNPDGLFQVFAQIQNRFLPALFLVIATTATSSTAATATATSSASWTAWTRLKAIQNYLGCSLQSGKYHLPFYLPLFIVNYSNISKISR